jgi:GntR family transcriptional regulator / MocR family aminotransferase
MVSSTKLETDGATVLDYQLLMSNYAARSDRRMTQQSLLYECLRKAILDGVIRPGSQLIPSRALAEQLGIARNSVLYAYERLTEQGFITTSRHGSVVSRVAPSSLAAQARDDGDEAPPLTSRLSRRAVRLPRERAYPHELTAFRPGVPALDAFPVAKWRASVDRAWRAIDARDLGYGVSAGHPALRRAIAEYVRVSRSVRCTADQVFVTEGTQAALDLCARLFADPGERVWVENPGYHGARAAFGSAGLELVPVPVDGAGLAPPDALWESHPPRLIYVTPSHQYPLGSVLSLERRRLLIGHAQQCGAWIVEDDYDSELRHGGPPLPSVQGLADDAPVVYLGTFSKTMFPALRMGFMIVPAARVAEFSVAHTEIARQGRVADQLALADFIESGQYARHLRRMRRLYQQRRDAVAAAIERHMDGMVTLSSDGGGMHLTMRLDAPLSDRDVSDAVTPHGLHVAALSGYCMRSEVFSEDAVLNDAAGEERRYNGFMLGYANVPAERADALIATLASAIRKLCAGV